MQVYHFVGATLRDGSPVPEDGAWLEYTGEIIPCELGLHGSEHPFDALTWAPGSILCLCDLEGDLQPHGDPMDKWVGRRRRINRRINADLLLRRFAADQALKVAHLWEMPPVVREYLTTLDETLREASWAASQVTLQASWALQAVSRKASRKASWAILAESQTSWEASRKASWAAILAESRASWEASQEEFRRRVEHAFQEDKA